MPLKYYYSTLLGILFFLGHPFNYAFGYLSNSYYQQLLIQARAKKLWIEPTWKVLLHYSPSYLKSEYKSLVDDERFFLSEQGKLSPQAELEATLYQLFHDTNKTDHAVSCRFPARTAWLKEKLKIDEQQLPKPNCQLLTNWLSNMKADSISIIFPVSVLNSPASMFGHTFLRFDRNREKQPDLMAWTVNYAARAENERGIRFALKGLFGGYPGKFSLARYYVRVKDYSDIESRDIWEYKLNFTQREILNLQLHLWELLPAFFDYYFIDENCTYQLLALLEAARPSLNLTGQFYWDAIPADTIKVITNIPGLLKKTKYRPSNRKIIQERSKQMATEYQQLARAIALGEVDSNDRHLTSLDKRLQARVLELAYDYAAFLDATRQKKRMGIQNFSFTREPEQKDLLYRLLTDRNHLTIKSQIPEIETPKFRPDQTHGGHRIALRYGYEDPRHFLQLDFRWAYHDQTDPIYGIKKNAQLEFFKPALRYYPQQQRFNIEAIDLVNIVSSPLWEPMIRALSWELGVSVNRGRFDQSSRPLMGDFRAGIGISYPITEQSFLSVFSNLKVNLGQPFNDFIAVAGGGRTQFVYDFNEQWQFRMHAQAMQYFQGIHVTSYGFGGSQRYALDTDQAVNLEVQKIKEFGASYVSAMLSWQYYF